MKHIPWIFLALLAIPFFYGRCFNREAKDQQIEETNTITIESDTQPVVEEGTLPIIDSSMTVSSIDTKDTLHIPSWVLSKYDDDWYETRLCEVNGKAYYIAYLSESDKCIIYDEKRVIFNYTHLRYGLVDEKETTRYWISTPYNHVEVDFAHPSQLGRLKELIAKPYPSLTYYRKNFDGKASLSLSYSFTLDYPTDRNQIDCIMFYK